MKKILGLDIGTNSIGWALVTEPETEHEESSILKTGVRIIASDTTHIRQYEEGKSVTLNADRRMKRSMRRNNQRYKLRRKLLLKKLVSMGMMTRNILEDQNGWDQHLKVADTLYLYEIRDRAVRGEQLTLEELGRVFYQLNQKRGYKSNRKAYSKEDETSEVEKSGSTNPKKKGLLEQIKDREFILKENGWTIGQFFYHKLLENPNIRIKQNTFTREAFQEEFDRIWASQQDFYPNVLTEDARVEIRDKILYYQRPLKSQKHLISGCQFETRTYRDKQGKSITQPIKVIPRSAPLFQYFKLAQQISNLTISNLSKAGEDAFNRYGERNLTDNERSLVFIYLDSRKRVKEKEVLKKVLGLNPNDGYKLNYEELEGNDSKAKIIEAFEKEDCLMPDGLLSFDPFQPYEKQPFFRLWHLIYSLEDPNHLAGKLEQQFQLPEKVAKRLAKVHLLPDYGNLSAKAILRLLPHLQKGLTYDKAQLEVANETGLEAYKRHKLTLDDQKQRMLAKAITEVKIKSLRNPVVEQILNQVVNLVNAIVADTDLVSEEERRNDQFEIRVEMARQLKSSAKQRAKTEKKIKENRQKNDEAVKKIMELGIAKPSLSDIEKYKLWLECHGVSPYSFEHIPLAKLFDKNYYEIEHIIPRARFFDDSLQNKTIAESSINRKKGNMTAYEYMESQGLLKKFERFVLDNKNFSKGKRKRMLDPNVPDDFVNRQLNETQYITSAIREKLLEISYTVTTTTGSITDYLRNDWGLNEVLQKLNWERYEAAGQVYDDIDKETGEIKKRIRGWSKRDDHRNHALDAIVVAFTRQGYIQSLNNLNQLFQTNNGLRQSGRKFPKPMAHFTRKVQEALESLLVSHRKTNKVATRRMHKHLVKGKESGKVQVTLTPRGRLHEETVYGKIKFIPEGKKGMENQKEDYVVRYPLNQNFEAKSVPYIVDKAVREKVRERLAQSNNDPKQAFKDLENNPIYLNEEQMIPIKKVRCFAGLKKPVALRENSNGEPKDFVQTGKNHHMAIYQDEDGNRIVQPVSFLEAVARKIAGAEVFQQEHEGKPLVATYAINDMIIVGLDPNDIDFFDPVNNVLLSKHLYRIQNTYADGKKIDIRFRHHLITKNEKTNEEKGIAKKMKTLLIVQSLKNLQGTKVFINRLGDITGIGETLRKLE